MDIIVESAIIPDLKSTSRDGVITELVEALIASGCISKKQQDDFTKAISDEKIKDQLALVMVLLCLT